MKFYHGLKAKNYFEGWYFKQSGGEGSIAFVVGVSADAEGKASAFLQIITDTASYQVPYPIERFHADEASRTIRLGGNLFSEKGITLNVQQDDVTLWGELQFGRLLPLQTDIMGAFRHFPMQCNHGVLSMRHTVTGTVTLNGGAISFSDGQGYLEKDWGRSFPDYYLWVQANRFPLSGAFFLSVAKIPFLGCKFRGFISVFHNEKTEYRFATYNGARILEYTPHRVVLQRGGLKLTAEIINRQGAELAAPLRGDMCRTIRESICADVHLIVSDNGAVVFNAVSPQAGYETADFTGSHIEYLK